jgi:hypothetical protein
MSAKNHVDCIMYQAIDVFKGLCLKNKTKVFADEKACESYSPAKKCKNCINYTSEEELLGLCMNKTVAYPEMLAKTCETFEWTSTPDDTK